MILNFTRLMRGFEMNDAWSRTLVLELEQFTFVFVMQRMLRLDSRCSPRSSAGCQHNAAVSARTTL